MNITFKDLKIDNETGLIRIIQAKEAWSKICRAKNMYPIRFIKLKGLADMAEQKRTYSFSGEIDWVIHVNQI